MTAEHLAARYLAERDVETVSVPTSPPGPGEVCIEVHYTGVCGTDLHIYHGEMDQRVNAPAVIGHEMSGRIFEVGPGVASDWKVGDPVTVMPLRWCGNCPACAAGHQHVCQRLVFVGIDSPGALQQFWNVPEEILVRLPEDMSLRDAALIEPTAVAVHDVRRSGLVVGEQALVVGAGPVGLLVATVARQSGAEVVVLEVDHFRRSAARAMGFEVQDPAVVDLVAYVEQWTDGAGVAVAFEVAGSQPALDLAVQALAVRGRLVVVAIHPRPVPVSLHRVFWRELTLIGARVYERVDFESAVELIAAGVVRADALVSSIVPLRDTAEAFRLLEGGGAVTKVLVRCRSEDEL